jgi:hypothetical protein
MSVLESGGSGFTDRFERWALTWLPESYEVDDWLAGIQLYRPEDRPKMIEVLRKAERARKAVASDPYTRLVVEQREPRELLESKGELPQEDPPDIKLEISRAFQAEIISRWWRWDKSLAKLREFLDEHLQSQETAGGVD